MTDKEPTTLFEPEDDFICSLPPGAGICYECFGEGVNYAIEYFEGERVDCEACNGRGWMPAPDGDK